MQNGFDLKIKTINSLDETLHIKCRAGVRYSIVNSIIESIWNPHKLFIKEYLDNFLSGWRRSLSGGYFGGLQYSWFSDPTNKTTATGVGVVSPGGGVGESYNFTFTDKSIKW